jgi:hypothetical protein
VTAKRSYVLTRSGRVSRTVALVALSVLSQATPLVLWMQGVVSDQAWAITAGVAGMVSAIAGMVLRQLTSEPMQGADKSP